MPASIKHAPSPQGPPCFAGSSPCIEAGVQASHLVRDDTAGLVHLRVEGNGVRAAHDFQVFPLLFSQDLRWRPQQHRNAISST